MNEGDLVRPVESYATNRWFLLPGSSRNQSHSHSRKVLMGGYYWFGHPDTDFCWRLIIDILIGLRDFDHRRSRLCILTSHSSCFLLSQNIQDQGGVLVPYCSGCSRMILLYYYKLWAKKSYFRIAFLCFCFNHHVRCHQVFNCLYGFLYDSDGRCRCRETVSQAWVISHFFITPC